jgi:very-short-patch-repair endonuclease
MSEKRKRGVWKNDSPALRSKRAKEACARKTVEAKQRSSFANVWVSKTPDEKAKIIRKSVKTRSKNQKRTNAKIAKAVQTYWNNVGSKEKKTRTRKALKTSNKKYKLFNGKKVKFHSSWEAACANVLEYLECEYEVGVMFKLGKYHYHADFVLPDKKIIIEVKGRPQARERWDSKTEPALQKYLHKKHGSAWKVYLLTFCVAEYDCYSKLKEFLKTMDHIKLG